MSIALVKFVSLNLIFLQNLHNLQHTACLYLCCEICATANKTPLSDILVK